MAKRNEAKIQFTADCKQFNAEIQKSNSTMTELRAELKLNEAEMKANGVSIEGLEKKHSILQSQLDASKDKTQALSGKLDAAIRNFGEGSTEVDKYRTQLVNAQTAQVKLEQALRECDSEIDNLDNSLENVNETAEKTNEGFTVMKGVMADLVADGIQAAASGLVDISKEAFTMANDIDKATNTFITKTGESKESAGDFEEVMTEIYNGNYGESFEDIADAMATVKTSLGDLSDAELKKVTTDAIVLRDTFDMDVNESVRAVNSLMDQFGITADEAFNLVAQGAQNGLNQNGDLLDVINEYAVQFENAGYSADDMFNMLSNGVESGTWSVDKLGDAVKEFNIRMSDGSAKDAVEALGFSWESVSESWSAGGDEAKEVFNMLFNELDGLEDTTEGYGIGVGLLGTMYEDLGQDAVLALSQTDGAISKSKNALEEIDSIKYNDIGSAIEGIKRNLQTSLAEPIKNEVMPAVNEFVEDVDWDGVGQTVGEAFGAVAEGAVAVANGIKDATRWMKEHKGVVIAVASVIGVLTAAITAYNIVQGIKAAMDAAQVTTVWALVAAHLAQAAAAIAAIAPYVLIVAAIAAVIAIIVILIKHWDDVVAACKKAWAKVKATLAQWGAWINANVIQPVKNFFSNLWSSVKNAASSAWNGIKSVWSVVKSWFNSTIIQPVGNFFTNLWSKVTLTASNAWNSVKSKATSAFNSVKSVIDSVKSKVSSVLDNVKSKFTSVFDNAKNIVRNAIDKIKGFFNFNWSLPKIKLPHFSISGKFSLNPPSIPKFSVDWYKDGGIFTKPTIFNTPFGLKGVGEAGAEAVLPIDRLEGYISGAIEKAQNVVNLQTLANAIEDLASRPVVMNINGRQFATATASASDGVNGLRTSFKNRGLIVD